MHNSGFIRNKLQSNNTNYSINIQCSIDSLNEMGFR